MNALYFDSYIRPGAAPFSEFGLTANILSSYDKLELPIEKAKFSTEPILVQCGDGTQHVDGEKVVVELGTIKVTKAEYDHLRDTFNNKKTDILLLDPNNDEFMIAAFGVKTSVSIVAESGATMMIMIRGERSISIETTNAYFVGQNTPACVITGNIVTSDGTIAESIDVTAAVSDPERDYTATTDKDGNFHIMVQTPALPGKATVVLSFDDVYTLYGEDFDDVTLEVTRYGEYNVSVIGKEVE